MCMLPKRVLYSSGCVCLVLYCLVRPCIVLVAVQSCIVNYGLTSMLSYIVLCMVLCGSQWSLYEFIWPFQQQFKEVRLYNFNYKDNDLFLTFWTRSKVQVFLSKPLPLLGIKLYVIIFLLGGNVVEKYFEHVSQPTHFVHTDYPSIRHVFVHRVS